MKKISYILSLIAVFILVSCVDYSDATQGVEAKIQLQLPTEMAASGALEGHTVTLKKEGSSFSAQTDALGIATFSGLIPDVYNVAVTWDLSAVDYQSITGSSEATSGATVSGSLNGQLIDGKTPLTLTTSLAIKRDIVIGKIYVAGSKDIHNKAYRAGQYIELYNQSADSVDVSGLYIGLLETDNPQAYTLENLQTDYADSVVLVKQVFRIPADKPHKVAPGGSVVLTNSAIDHTVNAPMEQNLLHADYEAKDKAGGRTQNNPDVPALETVFNIFPGIANMNLTNTFQGVIIFRTTADVAQFARTYKYGKTAGTQYLLIPKRYIIDGVDYLRRKATGVDAGEKRLPSTIDAGYTNITATAGLSGEIVYRKTSSTTASGNRILMDTNNSSNDFQVSTTIKVREW